MAGEIGETDFRVFGFPDFRVFGFPDFRVFGSPDFLDFLDFLVSICDRPSEENTPQSGGARAVY
jgi:hypothetical protein